MPPKRKCPRRASGAYEPAGLCLTIRPGGQVIAAGLATRGAGDRRPRSHLPPTSRKIIAARKIAAGSLRRHRPGDIEPETSAGLTGQPALAAFRPGRATDAEPAKQRRPSSARQAAPDKRRQTSAPHAMRRRKLRRPRMSVKKAPVSL